MPKRLQIALDARLTHYTKGGIAFYARQLAAYLPALDPDNCYLVLHSARARHTLDMPPNARRLNCLTPAHHRFERLALGAELAPRRLHLLHSPDFIPPLGAFRSVITIHDLTFLHYPQFLTAESRRYYKDHIRYAVQRADAILADSNATRDDILSLLNVAAERVTTVYLAPDPQFGPVPPDSVTETLARLELPATFILFVGTFEPRKNIPSLLKAYASLPPDTPPLVLAGSRGWLFDSAMHLARDLAIADRLYLLQDFRSADLPAVYNAAAALVLPSHYEGFGLPVLEAFACGAPVIISDRASLPEIAGGAAALCDPDDIESIAHAIRRVLAESDYRQSLVRKGFARVKEFSWPQCARRTLQVYRQALA